MQSVVYCDLPNNLFSLALRISGYNLGALYYMQQLTSYLTTCKPLYLICYRGNFGEKRMCYPWGGVLRSRTVPGALWREAV